MGIHLRRPPQRLLPRPHDSTFRPIAVHQPRHTERGFFRGAAGQHVLVDRPGLLLLRHFPGVLCAAVREEEHVDVVTNDTAGGCLPVFCDFSVEHNGRTHLVLREQSVIKIIKN